MDRRREFEQEALAKVMCVCANGVYRHPYFFLLRTDID